MKLAKHFGFEVTGIDPMRRRIGAGNTELAKGPEEYPELHRRVRFELGTPRICPSKTESVDLV